MASLRFRIPMSDDPWRALSELKGAAAPLGYGVCAVVEGGELRVAVHFQDADCQEARDLLLTIQMLRGFRYLTPDGF